MQSTLRSSAASVRSVFHKISPKCQAIHIFQHVVCDLAPLSGSPEEELSLGFRRKGSQIIQCSSPFESLKGLYNYKQGPNGQFSTSGSRLIQDFSLVQNRSYSSSCDYSSSSDALSQVKEFVAKYLVLPHKFHRGTLIIISRGSHPNPIYLGGDGISWAMDHEGKPVPSVYNTEKVITMGKMIIATAGSVDFTDHLIKLLKVQNFDSAKEAAVFVASYMQKTPYLNFMRELGFRRTISALKHMFKYGSNSIFGFVLYFASANDLAVIDNYQGKGFFDPYDKDKTYADGLCMKSANESIKQSEIAGLPVEKTIMSAFATAYRSSSENEGVGGRIVVKSVDGNGVAVVFDGTVEEMINKYKV